MSKLKSPLLSLGAHGTLANELTFQKRGTGTMIRRKPIPIDRRTLPQIYHRWLYQDYVAYWNDQAAETKQLWETNARPHHMTGFAYWMSYHLANLPDIAAGYHLDERAGITTIDFSKNKNSGVIYGALHQAGKIDYCLYFDGLDDSVQIPNDPSLKVDFVTLEAWIYPTQLEARRIICKAVSHPITYPYWDYSLYTHTDGFLFEINVNNIFKSIVRGTPVANTWQHIAATYDGTYLSLYVDGARQGSPLLAPGTITSHDQPVYIGQRPTNIQVFKGQIDEPRIYNRPLTISDLKRHSERRYP